MTTAQSPRSHYYDGAFYARFMDPPLVGLHRALAGFVKPGTRVLDVGCGTGSFAFSIAEKAAEVVGLELSPAMVDFAEARRSRDSVQNVSFILGDAATALQDQPDQSFDSATMVLALHEMPAAARVPVLREVCRLANRLVVVDFPAPLPRNLPGLWNRALELVAGLEHFRAYRDFARRGGIPGIAAEAGLAYTRRRLIDGGTLEVSQLRLETKPKT